MSSEARKLLALADEVRQLPEFGKSKEARRDGRENEYEAAVGAHPDAWARRVRAGEIIAEAVDAGRFRTAREIVRQFQDEQPRPDRRHNLIWLEVCRAVCPPKALTGAAAVRDVATRRRKLEGPLVAFVEEVERVAAMLGNRHADGASLKNLPKIKLNPKAQHDIRTRSASKRCAAGGMLSLY